MRLQLIVLCLVIAFTFVASGEVYRHRSHSRTRTFRNGVTVHREFSRTVTRGSDVDSCADAGSCAGRQ